MGGGGRGHEFKKVELVKLTKRQGSYEELEKRGRGVGVVEN